jgi:anti-anti-sigma factor
MSPENEPIGESGLDTRTIALTGNRGGHGSILPARLVGNDSDLEACDLVLDFRKVQYLASTDIANLVSLKKRLTGLGGKLTLINVNADIHDIFKATRLDTFFAIRR